MRCNATSSNPTQPVRTRRHRNTRMQRTARFHDVRSILSVNGQSLARIVFTGLNPLTADDERDSRPFIVAAARGRSPTSRIWATDCLSTFSRLNTNGDHPERIEQAAHETHRRTSIRQSILELSVGGDRPNRYRSWYSVEFRSSHHGLKVRELAIPFSRAVGIISE